MRSMMTGSLVLAALMLTSTLPAPAQIARPQTALFDNHADLLTLVRERGDSHARWSDWRRHRHNRDGRRVRFGITLSEPLFTEPYAYADDSAVAYCMSRFRSYDPAIGMYLGFDGLWHPCP